MSLSEKLVGFIPSFSLPIATAAVLSAFTPGLASAQQQNSNPARQYGGEIIEQVKKGEISASLQCPPENSRPNLLDLFGLSLPHGKEADLKSGNYKVVVATDGNTYAVLETPDGTRYFTIKPRNPASKGVLDATNGYIDLKQLRGRGDRSLEFEITYSELVNGRLKPTGLRRPELEYKDNCPPKPDTVKIEVPVPYPVPTKPDTIYLELPELKSNRLTVDLWHSVLSQFDIDREIDCYLVKFNGVPRVVGASTFMRIMDDLIVNASLKSAYESLKFTNEDGSPAGGYNATDLSGMLHARFLPINLGDHVRVGPGFFGRFDALTQKGNVNEKKLNGSSKRYTGSGGIEIAVSGISDADITIGVYAGQSSEGFMRNQVTAVLSMNNLEYKGWSFGAQGNVVRYRGNEGDGTIAEGDINIAGPYLLGFLRPLAGAARRGIMHPFDNATEGKRDFAPGTQNFLYLGGRADTNFFRRNSGEKDLKTGRAYQKGR